jgi:hypothetical protein
VVPPRYARTPPPPPHSIPLTTYSPPPPRNPLTTPSYRSRLPSTPVPHLASLNVCHISRSPSTFRSLAPVLHSSSSQTITISSSYLTLSPPAMCPVFPVTPTLVGLPHLVQPLDPPFCLHVTFSCHVTSAYLHLNTRIFSHAFPVTIMPLLLFA